MIHAIDTTSANKAATYLPRHGYDYRRGAVVRSIVIHSTNGAHNSSFADETQFLFSSALVSAHYLIGKNGEIIQFLDPRRYAAWHAGEARTGYGNTVSIGIELHHSVGELYSAMQLAALTWLTQRLMHDYAIPTERIATHRAIALPPGRKVDPSDWSDADFARWRDRRVPRSTTPPSYRTVVWTPVFTSRDPSAALAQLGDALAVLPPQTMEIIDDIRDGWAHLASGLGFVPLACLERIEE